MDWMATDDSVPVKVKIQSQCMSHMNFVQPQLTWVKGRFRVRCPGRLTRVTSTSPTASPTHYPRSPVSLATSITEAPSHLMTRPSDFLARSSKAAARVHTTSHIPALSIRIIARPRRHIAYTGPSRMRCRQR